MANVKSLSLYRNTSSLFANKEAAIAAIEAQNPGDGVAILARYKAGDDIKTIKTLLGLQATTSAITGAEAAGITGSTYKTIIDVEGNEEKIEEILAQLEALSGSTGDTSATTSVAGAKAYTDDKVATLDYTDTAVTGSYVSKVNEVDGVISVNRVALPTVAAITEAGKPIVAVAESLGEISASAGTIDAQYVNVADAGDLFSASTVEAVLAEIDAAYKAADEAIVGDATTSGDTLGKLEDRIEALDADAKEYHIVKTTTELPAEIKERYSLVDADGNVSGDTIDIPKDSHIVSITYITNTGDTHYQNLEYVYIDASGNTKTEYVDISSLVLEAEFASGVGITNHVAHGVVDPTSEAFLTVGADGFKLAGVQDAIDAAVNSLDASESGSTDTVTVKVFQTDGKVSSVVVETLAELLSGVTVNGKSATVANHVASVVISGSDINVGTYTNQGEGDPISSGDTIAEAFSGVVSTIMSNELVTSAALNDLNERVDAISGTVTDMSISGVSGVNATTSEGTTTLSAVAPAQNTEDNSLDNPITITQNGIEFATTLDCGTY